MILQSENGLREIFITLITSIYIVTVLLMNKYKLKSLHIASVICCFRIQWFLNYLEMEQEHKMSCVQYIWNVSSFKREPYILIAWHFCIGIAHLFAEPHFRLCFSMFLLSCYIINKCAGCLFSIYSLDYFTHTFLINFALNTIGIKWGWLRVKFQTPTCMQ